MATNSSEQASVNEFARQSFRNTADRDYLMARASFRYECDQQFKWCALQAVEKYLKAILIYNRTSAKGLSHRVHEALDRVQSIDDLEFRVPEDVDSFIMYLEHFAQDRYLSYSTFMQGHALEVLDKSVWYLRRYCFDMRVTHTKDDQIVSVFEKYKSYLVSDQCLSNPHLYKLQRGLLEDLLKKGKPGSEHIVWKNFYYGRRRKNVVKNYKYRTTSESPVHVRKPEMFAVLDELVDFPRAVKNEFREQRVNEN